MPSIEELRAAVEAEFAKQNAPVAPAEVVDPQPTTPVEGEPYQTKEGWAIDIDLKDGSGVQTFKAPTQKGLIAALAKAQENATRKIRELNQRMKSATKPEPAKPAPKFEPSQLTSDEQFLLSQELQTNPTGAVAKLFKATVGATPDEIREALAEARMVSEQMKAQREGAAFMSAHPEYKVCAKNEQAMIAYLEKHGLAFTKANLEIAFEDLTEAGLVDVNAPAKEETKPAPQPQVQVRKRAHVGLSSRQSVPDGEEDEPTRNRLTVEEMLKLTPDEQRRIVTSSFKR